MTQVVLIRPGATVYDEQNRVQGTLDIPLSERGRAEVAHLAETLVERLKGTGHGSENENGNYRSRFHHGLRARQTAR